jgi:hypothetical protein
MLPLNLQKTMMEKTKIESVARLDKIVVGASTPKVEALFIRVRPRLSVQLMSGILVIAGDNHAHT